MSANFYKRKKDQHIFRVVGYEKVLRLKNNRYQQHNSYQSSNLLSVWKYLTFDCKLYWYITF